MQDPAQVNEGKKEEGEEQSSTVYKNKRAGALLLRGLSPNGNDLVNFNEEIVDPNGDCGFTTLGVTRKQVRDLLLTLSDDKKYRERLEEEIYSALMGEEIEINDIEWTVVKKPNFYKEQKELDNLIRKFKEKFKENSENLDKFIEWLYDNSHYDEAEELRSKRLAVFRAEAELHIYCLNKKTFEWYVEGLGNKFWLGYKSALLYAEFASISLYIWRRVNKDSNQISLFHSQLCASPSNIINILHTDGFTHFNLLTIAKPEDIIALSDGEIKEAPDAPLLFSGVSINNADTEPTSKISRAYSWFSHFWSHHNIPTKILLGDTKNEIDRVNWITSFTDGAGWVLRNFGPAALLTLLAHDFFVYWDQSKNCDQPLNCHYGATPGNILLGTSPSELSWASQFGGYLETELNFWLLPILLPITMFGGGILNRLWHYYRHEPLNKDKNKEKDFDIEARTTLLRNYTSNILNDTYYWVLPFSPPYILLLSRLEFLLRWDSHLQDADRKIIFDDIIFDDIKYIARNYHSLARLYAQSSLSRLADSFHGQDDENKPLKILQEQAANGNYYAKYLLWTLGKTPSTKSKIEFSKTIALHAIFWVTSIYFSLRLPASLVFKFFNLVEYLKQKATCEITSGYEWGLVPEIADYECLISACNSPDVYYLYRSNVQECLNAFLSKPRSADDIKTFLENLPGTFDSVSFKNQSWYLWSPEDLKSVLDIFAKRFPILKMFDLSIDQYKEITIDNGIIDVLTNFFQKVGIWQIDIHNLGMGADPVNKILLAINRSITDWLDLSRTDSDDSVAETLKSIMPHTFFKVIKAAGNYFTDNGIGDIAQGAENSTLANLDVSYNPYGPAGWKSLSDSLPKTQLNTLTARGVDSSQVDFGGVGRAIVQTPTLETFNIPDTNINDRQVEEFSAEAKSSRLKSWDLSGTGVTGEGASNAIRNFKNSTLEEINLSKLRIQGKDLKGISEGLSGSNIRRLRISGIGISPDDFCQFTTSLNQTSVDTLDAGKNGIKDQGAICLGNAIADPNSKLRNVQVPGNGISEKGGMKMMQAVADSNRVNLLDMSKNSFAGLNGASAGNMLQQNQQLETVILDNTNIGPEVGEAIGNKLSKAKQLKQLSLNNNPNLGNAANKKIAQNLIKPIANMNKLGGKLSNDQLRDLHHAKNQTQIDYLGVENTSLQNDGAREFCQVWPATHNALDQLQAGNNLVNEVNMENCQTSEASKLPFGNFGKYFTAGYIFYNLFNYFFTDHREWTLDDNDRKQIEQYKTKLEYLKNQHKPQITSVATKNPNLNYLFEKVADLCYAVTAILTGVEKTKEFSDTILEAVKERLAAIEKNIQEISQYNKEMRSKHNKARRQRFEKRCKRTEESGVVITRRNVLTGKITQRFFVATDAKTIEFLTANKQTLVAERKTKSMRFTEMQQFWQLQGKAEGLLIDLKKLAPEDNNVISSAASCNDVSHASEGWHPENN